MDQSKENKPEGGEERATTQALAGMGAELAEPFACPNCGQMLAPACRVCVACRETVDFTKVAKQAGAASDYETPAAKIEPSWQPSTAPTPSNAPASQPPPSAQFSWPIFFICVAAYVLIGYGAEHILKKSDLSWFVAGLLTACAVWVYVDARLRKIPYPLRWAVGSFLIWIVAFPWYLSRRRKPKLACAIMESPARAFLRTVIWVLLFCAILGLISAVMRRPPH
ncbi:MAG: hypothetical protein KGM47_11820 [Acidobacteriota bacterium]|nr:hypothetical protein [Acidobacteriota bacterium]